MTDRPVGPSGAAAVEGATGPVVVEIGRGAAGWWLRALLAVVSAVSVVIALSSGGSTGVTTVLGFALFALVVGTTVSPGSIAATLLVIGVVGAHLLAHTGELSPGVGVQAALLLAVHQLAGACSVIPTSALVQWAALRPMLIRFALGAGVVEIGVVLASLLQ